MLQPARLLGVCFTLCLFVTCLASSAKADFVVAYEAVDTESALVARGASGVTGMNLIRGAGVQASLSGITGVYQTDKWSNSTEIATDHYLSFGISSSATPVALTELHVNLSRTAAGPKAAGPEAGVIQASVNGSAFGVLNPIMSGPRFSIGETAERVTVDLSTSSLDFSRVTSVEFRLFAFDAKNNGTNSELNIHNFSGGVGEGFGIFVGGIQAVPEPTSLALIGVCAAGAGFRWRTKRRGAAAKQQPLAG